MKRRDHIDVVGFLILACLTLLWGVNYPVIKVTNRGLSPIFNSLLRSVIASIFGIGYCLFIKQPLFHRDIRLFHGFVVGLLFGLEFICVYISLMYTDAARSVIFMNLSPFVVAIGAYFVVKERMSLWQIAGLVLAFLGAYLVLQGKPHTWTPAMLLGDVIAIAGAFFWGATTVYIKKYLAERVHPIHTFLYQLVFSVPVILVFALALEPRWIIGVTPAIVVGVLYSSIVVAFASYLMWFELIHAYPISKLAVFTFLMPVFGAAASCIFLGEQMTAGLVVGLSLVCAGIYATNYRSERVAQGCCRKGSGADGDSRAPRTGRCGTQPLSEE
ncbi:MAG: DMT family transporter [Syntrophorhabdales bacterium]